MKILKLLYSFTNKIKGLKGTSAGKGPAVTREDAITVLTERGESPENALLIVETMEEWGLDYDLAASMDFKVVGKSVWIDAGE